MGIHEYTDGPIQFLGSRVHRDVLDRLNLSCDLSRDEAGTQLHSLRDVQGQLDGGVN